MVANEREPLVDLTDRARSNVSQVIRLLMAAAGMRYQKELAAIIDVSPSQVTRKMGGDAAWTLEDLLHLGDYFEVSPATFFDDAEVLAERVLNRGSASGYKPDLTDEIVDRYEDRHELATCAD